VDTEIPKTGAIDDMHRAISQIDDTEDNRIKDGKGIIEKLATLKYELQHDRQLLWDVLE
jgi:damage-control phosphatase, subfamily III